MGKASASINGWNFQVTAGIILFFDLIKNIRTIKIEGEKEDIEIVFNDKSILYCQAKAIEDIDDTSNTSKHYKSALKSLENNSGNKKLMYVTNILNPFGVVTSRGKYLKYGEWSYCELPTVIDIINKQHIDAVRG